jgi:hypothetical protein
MKKILLSFLTICALASGNTAKAQGGGGANSCQLVIDNVVITKTAGPTSVTGGCQYTFDASFDILSNAGFDYLYFHSWTTGAAGGYGSGSFDCSKNGAQNPPTASRLGTSLSQAGVSFLDFGLINLKNVVFSSDPANPTDITGHIATVYQNDNTVPLNFAGATATVYRTATTSHYEIKNITVIIAGACGPFDVVTDIWGSNSGAGTPQAQCYICGRRQTIINPGLALTKNCTTWSGTDYVPSTWQLTVTATPSQDLNVIARVYFDVDGDGNQDATDPIIYTSPSTFIAANTSVQFTGAVPLPYCCDNAYSTFGVFAKVEVAEFGGDEVATPVVEVACGTLPIKLRSFDANRNKSNVDLKWVTEIEDNNKGFYVERKLSNGGWQEITFVASQAPNGNSNSPLTYTLTDFNNTKGISQYRLRQVDIDHNQAYSQIRSVRGEGQKSNTIIYPNPSGDGKVNIVFEGANSIRDVSLMDVSGKTLKQWKGVTNNNIQIDNLNAGFYTVRIVNIETGEQVVEKFIVNKR